MSKLLMILSIICLALGAYIFLFCGKEGEFAIVGLLLLVPCKFFFVTSCLVDCADAAATVVSSKLKSWS